MPCLAGRYFFFVVVVAFVVVALSAVFFTLATSPVPVPLEAVLGAEPFFLLLSWSAKIAMVFSSSSDVRFGAQQTVWYPSQLLIKPGVLSLRFRQQTWKSAWLVR
jgi:tetrahydromethanopterin S-methyltransferase subunit E